MGRKKLKIEIDESTMGVNPFIENFEIYVTKKTSKVINAIGYITVKDFDLEKTPYTKIFEVEGAKKQVCDLPIRSKELYLYFIHSIKGAKDYLRIDKDAYMKQMGIKSVNTYKEAIKGLSDNSYIYPHYSLRDVYWINPHFFFKGSRITKYPDAVKYNKTIKAIVNGQEAE